MARVFWITWMIVLVFWTAVFSGLVWELAFFVSNVNNNVVVFLPPEFKLLVLIIWFWLIYRMYQWFKG